MQDPATGITQVPCVALVGPDGTILPSPVPTSANVDRMPDGSVALRLSSSTAMFVAHLTADQAKHLSGLLAEAASGLAVPTPGLLIPR